MANYQLLKADIDEKVYQNGHQEITGENLNFVLNQMVTTLGAEYQFAGVATKDTNPGTPDAKVFYIANGKGTYTNFGGINVTEDEVVVLYWDTAWHKVSTGIASDEKLSELETKVDEYIGESDKEMDLSLLEDTAGNVTTTNYTGNAVNYKHKNLPVIVGETYTIKANKNARCAFIKTVGVSPNAVDFADGQEVTWSLSANEEKVIVVPDTANYLAINTKMGDGNVVEWHIVRAGKEGKFPSQMKELDSKINSVDDKLADTKKTILSSVDVYASVIDPTNRIVTSGIGDSFLLTYYKCETDNESVTILYTRSNSYVYNGKIFVKDNDVLTAGEVVDVIEQVPLNESREITRILTRGQIIGVSRRDFENVKFVKTEKVPIDLSQLKEACDVIIAKGLTPTEYEGGDMSAFNDILCIGDSLTQGVFNHNDISGETYPASEKASKYSYPSNLERLTGSNVTNLGVGGITSYGWLERFRDDERLSGKDCAIIQLCVNDDSSTIETRSADAIRDIITLLKEKNKGIKIFLAGLINAKSYPCSKPSNTYYAKDQMLRNLYISDYANDEQVFFIDHVAYGHLQSLESVPSIAYPTDNFNQGHLSAYGYWRLAKDYYSYISWIMANDKTNAFRNIQFTGTDFGFN